MKRYLVLGGLVFAVAAAVGFLMAAPAADADQVCNCWDLNHSVSGSAIGADCDEALDNLETELRSLAEQDCKSRYGSSSDDCNFAMDSQFSCYAIDFTGEWGVSGSATYDCIVCRDSPSPPPGP